MEISEKLKNLQKCKISEIYDLQGNLKDLSKDDFERLKTRIEQKGFKYPFYIWIDSKGKKWTLDGHSRKRVIETAFGYEIEVPYIEVFAENKKEAKKEILAISSDYGKVTKDGFDEFAAEFDEIDLSEIGKTTTFEKWFDVDFENKDLDYSDKNKEIDTDEFSDRMELKLQFTSDEFQFVQSELSKIDANKETAFLKLLNYES